MGKTREKEYCSRKRRMTFFGLRLQYWATTWQDFIISGVQFCKQNRVCFYLLHEVRTKAQWPLLLIRFGYLLTITTSAYLFVQVPTNLLSHFSGKLRDISSIMSFLNTCLATGEGDQTTGKRCRLLFQGAGE